MSSEEREGDGGGYVVSITRGFSSFFPPLPPPFPFRSYSTSRTCEMSLSNHSGIHFRSLLTLLDEAATPKKADDAKAAAA